MKTVVNQKCSQIDGIVDIYIKKIKMKTKITISEERLKQIVKETIDSFSKTNSVAKQLDEIVKMLFDITKSGFIPFSSPSPSSSEEEVAELIKRAMSDLEEAADICEDLYGKY